MKNKQLIRALIKLDYYTVTYNGVPSDEDMIYIDDNGVSQKVTDNGISDNDLILMMQADQTKYLKSIKNMVTFFVILAIIGICLMFYFGIQINNAFSYPY